MTIDSSSGVFEMPVQIRWADIDANNHLLHSVYYDWGAMIRMQTMHQLGLSMKRLNELRCGPIIFREEALFKREIAFGDVVTIDLQMTKARKDFARWSMQHQIIKNGTDVCTVINLDGAFIDLDKRKILIPPAEVVNIFNHLPKSADFNWLE